MRPLSYLRKAPGAEHLRTFGLGGPSGAAPAEALRHGASSEDVELSGFALLRAIGEVIRSISPSSYERFLRRSG